MGELTPTPVAVSYDPVVHAGYVKVGTWERVYRTVEVTPSCLLDYDTEGNVIGVELLGIGEPVHRRETDDSDRETPEDHPSAEAGESSGAPGGSAGT